MKIAVNLPDFGQKSGRANDFARQLWNRLPAQLPEATFLVDSAEGADQALHLGTGHIAGDLPTTILVTNVDHRAFPVKSWWRFWAQPADPAEPSIRAASAIIVPHAALRQRLIDYYGVSAAKVHVVGHGLPAGERAVTPADSVTRRITKEVYGNENAYFLAPATGHASDNLERLFAAYDLFRRRSSEPVRLLVEQPAGGTHPRRIQRAARRAAFQQDIVFLPNLSVAERRKLISAARAIVHVSLSTAFPVPVLEAWTAEVPLVGTDNAIMQGAGTLVQAEDASSIAEGLVTLTTTPFLASGVVENGKRRQKDFSWQAVAEQVAQLLRQH